MRHEVVGAQGGMYGHIDVANQHLSGGVIDSFCHAVD